MDCPCLLLPALGVTGHGCQRFDFTFAALPMLDAVLNFVELHAACQWRGASGPIQLV